MLNSQNRKPTPSHREIMELRKHVGEPSNEKRKYSFVQNNYKSYAKLGWNYISRYEPSFNGYFFSYNDYGHKHLNYGRRYYFSKHVLKCWDCNKIGHKAWDSRSPNEIYPSKGRVMKVWRSKECNVSHKDEIKMTKQEN